MARQPDLCTIVRSEPRASSARMPDQNCSCRPRQASRDAISAEVLMKENVSDKGREDDTCFA